MAKRTYTIDQIGSMLENLLDKLSPKNSAEWVSAYDLRTRFNVKKGDLEKYKACGMMRSKPFKPGSKKLLYDISKIKHLLKTVEYA